MVPSDVIIATAVYQEGETIISSNVACATPESFLAPSPTNVSATPLDEEVLLYWTESNVTQLGIPYIETFDEDSGLIDLWLIDGDNWVVSPFGNPAPSMEFDWQPAQENYNQFCSHHLFLIYFLSRFKFGHIF